MFDENVVFRLTCGPDRGARSDSWAGPRCVKKGEGERAAKVAPSLRPAV